MFVFYFYSSLKQEQSEQTSAALHNTIHKVEEEAEKLRKKLDDEQITRKEAQKLINIKELEINSLKNEIQDIKKQLVS